MNRRDATIGLLALGLAPVDSFSQQLAKVWRIGMLDTIAKAVNGANLDAFRRGLLALGYVEERNYVLEYRSADDGIDRIPELAAELVGRKVDLIVTRGTPAALACKKATATIPVVTVTIGNPLLVVASLARPGGNITGLTAINVELSGKRVQLLKEIVPGLARLASIRDMGNAASVSGWKVLQEVARSVGVQPLLFDVRKPEDLGLAFDRAVKQRADALLVSQENLTQSNARQIAELAGRYKLPAIYHSSDFVVNGGLISYGVNIPDQYRRAASYIDKIFKGAKPAELPMEQPTKFELMINLKTAKALGLKVPQSVLLRADEVIE